MTQEAQPKPIDNRITVDELKQIFGEYLPGEALRVLYETEMTEKSASDERLKEIRKKLRQIAAEHDPLAIAADDLRRRISNWILASDLGHGEASKIIHEVADDF